MDYRDYEEKVRKLLDEHVKATGTSTITELVNIFDVERFDEEVARQGTAVAKADTILNRMKRTATERMDEDPAFYRRFSELIEETIEAYRAGRLSEAEYLQRAERHLDAMRGGRGDGQPDILRQYQDAPAYYGKLQENLGPYIAATGPLAELAIEIEALIERRKVVNWTTNLDVQKGMKAEVDGLLYEIERQHGLILSPDELDLLIEQVMEIARARDGRGR